MSTTNVLSSLSAISFGTITLSKLVPALITLVICSIVIKILTGIIEKLISRSRRLDATLHGFIRSGIKIIMWIIASIIVAETLGIPTTSLVAFLSVAGLALSLSIQNTMANLFAGVTLLLTKPFVAGEYVDAGGRSGTIKTVGLFYTVMDTVDNMMINIPNSDLTASSVINYSREPLRRVDMIFSASYDDDTQAVKNSILRAALSNPKVLTEPAPFVALKEYKASSIDYVVRMWCNNSDYWDIYFYMNERVRECFKEDGIQMSYEHLNVHVVEK